VNQEALRHIAKAATHLARGEGSYRKAADEMQAAKDAGATWPEIGDGLGRSASWCRRIVSWAKTPANDRSTSTPFGGEAERERLDSSATRKVLRDAPLEQIEQLMGDLAPERRQAIAAAAGHTYSQARQAVEEEKKNRTPEEEKARQQDREESTRAARQATSVFTALGIVGHLEQATEELRELMADASLGPEGARRIERALEAFVREFNFAMALIGGDEA
jgi:hypothetical protein